MTEVGWISLCLQIYISFRYTQFCTYD